MSEINIKNKCLSCLQEFDTWFQEFECPHCEDGDEEVENEFGEGSFYRSCRECNGTGVLDEYQTHLCSEECIEDYNELKHKYYYEAAMKRIKRHQSQLTLIYPILNNLK